MLKVQSADPAWVVIIPAAGDVPAVELLLAPIGIKTVRAARAAVRAILVLDDQAIVDASDALSAEIMRRGILDWKGVGNAEGVPLIVSPDNIELFIADPHAFEATDRAYITPWAMRDQEKNGSSGSPSGTSVPATPEINTATSPADGGKTAGAKRARTRKPART